MKIFLIDRTSQDSTRFSGRVQNLAELLSSIPGISVTQLINAADLVVAVLDEPLSGDIISIEYQFMSGKSVWCFYPAGVELHPRLAAAIQPNQTSQCAIQYVATDEIVKRVQGLSHETTT